MSGRVTKAIYKYVLYRSSAISGLWFLLLFTMIIVSLRICLSYPCLLIPDLEPVDGDVNDDPLLVLPGGLNGHLELLQGVLAHAVAAGLLDGQHADQLALENLALAHELVLAAALPCKK